MNNRVDSTTVKAEQPTPSKPGRLRVTGEVQELEIDLVPPRLIRIVGRTSKGGLLERHVKITDKEKMLMV
jgi:hypothetical protein